MGIGSAVRARHRARRRRGSTCRWPPWSSGSSTGRLGASERAKTTMTGVSVIVIARGLGMRGNDRARHAIMSCRTQWGSGYERRLPGMHRTSRSCASARHSPGRRGPHWRQACCRRRCPPQLSSQYRSLRRGAPSIRHFGKPVRHHGKAFSERIPQYQYQLAIHQFQINVRRISKRAASSPVHTDMDARTVGGRTLTDGTRR